MLTITPQALNVLRRVTAHPLLKETSGLRIGRRGRARTALDVRTVEEPRPGDAVLERRGGRLYLAPEAVRRVDGAELDAVTDHRGRVQFILRKAA